MVNEFRVGFSRDQSSLNGEHNGGALLQQFGIQGATPNAVHGTPEFDFANFDSTYEFPDYEYTSQALEFLDNVTWEKGRHSVKMGTLIRPQ